MTDKKTDGTKNPVSTDVSTKPLPVERRPFNELSVLFPLLSFYTAGYLGLMVIEFFLRSVKAPGGMMTVYVALLGAYAADKEIRRWAGTPEPSRRGTVFVHLWMAFFLVAWLIHAFRPEFQLPGELGLVVLQVLGIFFGSKASKYIWEGRRGDSGELPELTDRHERIMALARERGQLTNREAAEAFHVSTATAKRLLADLVRLGRLRLEGEKRGSFYVPVNPASPPGTK